MLIIVFILLTALIFMQFGGRLAANQALTWLTTFVFLGVATAFPEKLRPLANLVGVELVSNLVLGGMIMLLIFQMIEMSAVVTSTQRKLRLAIASAAAQKFADRHSTVKNPGKATNALVVLPCFNEEDALPGVISQIKETCEKTSADLRVNYCFVDDGSLDGSVRILNQHCPENYSSHAVNIGVAGVLLTGFQIARTFDYDYVIQCDGDGQHPVQKIPDLIRSARDQSADLLIGSRYVTDAASSGKSADQSGQPAKDTSSTPARFLGARILKMAMSLFGKEAAVSDPTSGFRVYSAKAIGALLGDMPDEYPEPEAVVLAKLANLKIAETRVVMLPRTTGVSSLAGLKSITYMVKVTSALLGLRLRSLLQ